MHLKISPPKQWPFSSCRGPFQYPIRRFIIRSRKVSKARDWVLKCWNHFEIWQAPRQQYCRGACQISERSDNSKYKSRGFETLRDLTIRRLIGYWNGALLSPSSSRSACSWACCVVITESSASHCVYTTQRKWVSFCIVHTSMSVPSVVAYNHTHLSEYAGTHKK